MAKVDSKGRVVLPQELRTRLGITPGSEVDIHEEDGKAIVEPEEDPERIIDRMDQLVEEIAGRGDEISPSSEGTNPIAQEHRNAIRSGADNSNDE